MASVAQVACRKVAPLLARYNDPELSEVDRVLLSTHLLQCQNCRAQIQQYRVLDKQLRGMRSIVIEPSVRAAILDRVVASSGEIGASVATLPWRYSWSSAAVMFSLTTFLMAAGLVTALASQHPDARFAASAMTNGSLVRPATMGLLNANPTRAAGASGELMAFKRPVVQAQAQATRPAAVAATIRAIDQSSGRIVVTVGGARADERLMIMYDTAIVRANGYPGTINDLVVGLQVQLQREMNPTGSLIAREIMIGR